MLAALAKSENSQRGYANVRGDNSAPATGRKSKGKTRRAKIRATIDYDAGTIETECLPVGYVRLAPGELDDDLDDIFGPLTHVPVFPGAPFKTHNADGSVFLGEEVLKRAGEIKAERKAEAKEAAAEARRIRNAEKKAAGLPLRAPAKKTVLTGRDIPASIRGKVTVTGTINAKTGEALVIDVAFRNKVHSGIVVWAGAIQPIVAAAAEKGKALDLVIAQPANDRFKPSVRSAA